MDTKDAIRNLRLVVEKADKLRELSFTKYLASGGKVGFSGTLSDGEMRFETHGAARSDRRIRADAAILHPGQRADLVSQSRTTFREPPLDSRRIDAVKASRRTINEHLDKQSGITVRGKRLTRREIYDIFVYGGLAHANPRKKEVYDEWMSDQPLAAAVSAEFSATLGELFQAINWFRNASEQAADLLGGKTGE